MRRVHILVHGHVQGISFRAFAKREALRLGLTGFVQNLPDGGVEIIAEGDETLLRQLTEILKTRHPLAKIKSIDATWGNATSDYSDFRIVK